MLCERCETRIPYAFDCLETARQRRLESSDASPVSDGLYKPSQEGHEPESHGPEVLDDENEPVLRPQYVLHDSFDSRTFFNSIRLGCFVCRQVWYSLLDWRQYLARGECANWQSRVCHNFEDFSKEVAEMTHLATKHRLEASTLLASGVSFSVGDWLELDRLGNWVEPDRVHSMSFSFLEVGPKDAKLCWGQSFTFVEVQEEDAHGRCHYPKPGLQALSTSTSSIPQLWNYWFKTCKETHALCLTLDADHGFQPKRLVRIIPPLDDEQAELKWCLVFPTRAREPVEYVTLSHCWGSHPPYKLTDANLDALQRESPATVLPKTYLDAFNVALALGCRHIWIDSLCIIQENRQDWLEQSPQMASIYGGARCNIAATWASNGAQGCFNTRDPSTVVGTSIPISSGGSTREHHVTSESLYHRDFHDRGPLNSRGWVVQERCLSTRQLSFTRSQVYWECAELFASEQFPNGFPEEVRKEAVAMTVPSPTTAKPRLNHSSEDGNRQSWCSLVEIFSRCAFSHASDKMMALASLAGSLRQQTGDTYLAGLWKQDLHKQLLWCTVRSGSDHTTPPRRSPIYHAPSWSWANIDGHIGTERWYFGEGYDNTRTRTPMSIVDIISVTVETDDPGALHSFTSGELRMRAMVACAMLSAIRYSDHDGFQDWMSSKLSICHPTGLARGLGAHGDPGNYTARFRQDCRLEMEDQDPNSEFLLVFVSFAVVNAFTISGLNAVAAGLVLLEVKDGAGEQKFKRVGTFFDSNPCWFVEAVSFRLGIDPGTMVEEDGLQVDLDDPRLADLVRVVTII